MIFLREKSYFLHPFFSPAIFFSNFPCFWWMQMLMLIEKVRASIFFYLHWPEFLYPISSWSLVPDKFPIFLFSNISPPKKTTPIFLCKISALFLSVIKNFQHHVTLQPIRMQRKWPAIYRSCCFMSLFLVLMCFALFCVTPKRFVSIFYFIFLSYISISPLLEPPQNIHSPHASLVSTRLGGGPPHHPQGGGFPGPPTHPPFQSNPGDGRGGNTKHICSFPCPFQVRLVCAQTGRTTASETRTAATINIAISRDSALVRWLQI